MHSNKLSIPQGFGAGDILTTQQEKLVWRSLGRALGIEPERSVLKEPVPSTTLL